MYIFVIIYAIVDVCILRISQDNYFVRRFVYITLYIDTYIHTCIYV